MGDSSTGQIVGGVVGAVIGTIITPGTGTLYGASLGYALGGLVDPPEVKIPDPDRPSARDIQGATFRHNIPVPIVYGSYPVVGNVMFIGKTKTRLVKIGKKEVETGGKSGSAYQDVLGRWYDIDFAIGLSEGPIQSLNFVFQNQKNVSKQEGDRYTTYLGTPTQEVPQQVIDATLEDGDVPWRNTAYMMWHGTIGAMNSMPHMESWITGIDTKVEDTGTNTLVL